MSNRAQNSTFWALIKEKLSQHKLVIESSFRKTCVIHNLHNWQPCMFKLKVHTYQVIQSIKLLIFLVNTTLCQEEDVEVVLGESF